MKRSALLTILSCTSPALALDTLEPFGPGLSDAELYVGVENAGDSRTATNPFFSAGVGAGLTERLSLFVGYTATADGYLSQSAHSLEVSLYGNVGTWGPIAFDLGATLSEGEGSMVAAPFFELNWDFAPDQSVAGLFLHGGPNAAGVGDAVDWTWEQGLGGYYILGEGQQLLVEWSTGYDLGRTVVNQAWQRGTLAAGFNWTIADGLELIHEAGVTLPQGQDSAHYHGFAGFIATLPDNQ